MPLPNFLSKADVSPIVKGHLDTLVDARTGRASVLERLFFFASPLCLSIGLLYFHFGFRLDAVNGFLNAFAIFTGLLLNLLVLVFSLSASGDKSAPSFRKIIIKQVFTNVCYCILLSIGVVATSLIDLGYLRPQKIESTGPISTFVLSGLTGHFLLTLLMVMKRMYKLISSEFETSSSRKAA